VKIAVFHNRYVLRGGEDAAVELETELLRKAGHEVQVVAEDSRALGPLPARLRAGLRAHWNEEVFERVAGLASRERFDVGHVHNFFPLLTPAVHAALHRAGVPVVQTLHNYRLFCANGLFLRGGRPCEDCVAAGPWNAVRHRCYRGSALQTAAWAFATSWARRRGAWHDWVDRFVVPGEFARRKLVAAGLPADRVTTRPNAVPDPGEPRWGGHGAVYVGRLSAEKGVHLLLEAWRGLGGYPLALVGAGPEEAALRRRAADLPNVRFAGALPPDAVQAELARAAFSVAPSLCYENFPLAVAEAMAAGRAVVAPYPSALADLVEEGLTGLLFRSGDAASLADACRQLAADHSLAETLGREARERYEETLTPERGLQRLLAIYRDVRAARGM
jgi:glycosyltransferase involved in cell wall biosynthesis